MPLNKAQKQALKHSNKLGAGAKKRQKLKPKDKVAVVVITPPHKCRCPLAERKYGRVRKGNVA